MGLVCRFVKSPLDFVKNLFGGRRRRSNYLRAAAAAA